MSIRGFTQVLVAWMVLFDEYDFDKSADELNTYYRRYRELTDIEDKGVIVGLLSDAYKRLANRYQDSLQIFELLNCVNRVRTLTEDFPDSGRIAHTLLEMLTGLVYVKLQLHEDGMVEEYMDEVLEIAARFPESSCVQYQAGMCMGNLIALCGSPDAPFSLAYRGAERMETVLERMPDDRYMSNIYARILVSVYYFATRTDNEPRMADYRSRLRALAEQEAVNEWKLRMHLEQAGLSI